MRSRNETGSGTKAGVGSGGASPRRARIAATLVLLALATCVVAIAAGLSRGEQVASVGQASEPGELSFAQDIEPLLAKRCGRCHTADDPKGKLVLDPGQGYGQMVERASTQVPGMQIVAPGDATGSYLVLKLEHRASVGKGMPRTLFGAKKLPEKEIELIRRWIDRGAAP